MARFSKNLVLIIVAMLFVLRTIRCKEVNWCELNCKEGENTACKYKGCHTRANCHQLSLSKEDKDYVLQLHNEIRDEFAKTKSASNMMTLSWDKHLEYVAQCLANQCPDVKSETHDVCRNTPQFNKARGVGQNMHAETGTPSIEDLTLNAIMEGWYHKEINNVPNSAYSKFYLKPNLTQETHYGHATQLLWADVTHIGCGVSRDDETKFNYLYCNYGPAGNVINETVFKPGKPTSKCPNEVGPNEEYSNLCGEIEYESENLKTIFVDLYNDLKKYVSSIFHLK